MKQLIEAAVNLLDASDESDCRVLPEVTLTFNTGGDLARFERTMKAKTDALTMHWVRQEGHYEFAGLRFNLVVRQ